MEHELHKVFLQIYTVSGKGATLFSTRTLAFFGRFFYNFVPLETEMNTAQSDGIYLLMV